MSTDNRLKRSAGPFHSERGSLPMALLAVIIFAGLMTVVVATTIAGQRSARFDRDFMQVVNSADSGIQEVLWKVNAGQLNVAELVSIRNLAEPNDRRCEWGAVDGMSYQWCARALDDDGKALEVAATGDVNGVQRTVVAELHEIPAVPFVAYGENHVQMRGGNQLGSFDSRVTGCPTEADWSCAWSPGTSGIIATNGTVTLLGSDTNVNEVHLYDFVGDNARYDRCTQTGTGGGSKICTDPEPEGRRPRLSYQDDMEFIQQVFAGGCPNGQQLPVWRSSEQGGAPSVGDLAKLPPPMKEGEVAEYYCVGELDFDRDTELVNAAGTPLGVGDPGIVVYVQTQVRVRRQAKVGCQDCELFGRPPRPGQLRIYSMGVGNGKVDLRTGTSTASILYAPAATCGSGGSSNLTIFGGLVCDEISNQGGWTMYYDEALFSDGTGRYGVDAWREEPGLRVEAQG